MDERPREMDPAPGERGEDVRPDEGRLAGDLPEHRGWQPETQVE